MATDRALLTKLKVLGAALETTTGTAATLSGTTAVFNVMDLNWAFEIPPVERQGQGSLTPLQPVPGARAEKITFKHEVVGSGTTTDPGWLAVFLASCGWVGTTGTYAPVSGAIATATLGGYQDGQLWTAVGAMGKVTIDAEAGKPAVCSFEYSGVWAAPSATALVTPTYPVVIPPRFASSTITIGGTTYRVAKVQIVIDNTLTLRQDAAATNATGYHACAITGRKISVKLSLEAQALGTQDWFAAHVAGTNYAFNLVLGTVAHNIITIAAPSLVLLNAPGIEDANGIYHNSLEFLAYSATPDGEMTIAVS